MKTHVKLIFTVLCITYATMSLAQSNIEVTVRNIRETKGTILVGLYTNEENYLKKAVEGKVVKAAGTEVKVVFENLKPGEYAVSVIHDENENGELDKNGIGMPKEGFAFGNNAMGIFGPPSFEKAKIVVGKTPVKQVIELKYF